MHWVHGAAVKILGDFMAGASVDFMALTGLYIVMVVLSMLGSLSISQTLVAITVVEYVVFNVILRGAIRRS